MTSINIKYRKTVVKITILEISTVRMIRPNAIMLTKPEKLKIKRVGHRAKSLSYSSSGSD